MHTDNFDELRSGKPKRARAVAPVAIPIEADIAAVTLVEPVAAAPVELPPAAAPADIHHEEPPMTTIENMTDTATQTAQTATEKTQAHFADMNARATDAMAKGQKMFAEMNSFTKGNVEALVESGKLAVSGMQTVAQHQAAFVRQQFEAATAAARTMATVKSPTEFVKLQGDFVRQHFDAMVAEGSRSTETMLKLVGEVVQPVANRVAVAVERVKQAA